MDLDVERNRQIIELAQEQYTGHSGEFSDGDVNIEDDAIVSEGTPEESASRGSENGCYVAAWVWVNFSGTPLDKPNTHK